MAALISDDDDRHVRYLAKRTCLYTVAVVFRATALGLTVVVFVGVVVVVIVRLERS